MTVDSIDVEDRLRAVKVAAGRRRTHVARDRVVLASASAGAATALVIYLRWRAGHRAGRVTAPTSP